MKNEKVNKFPPTIDGELDLHGFFVEEALVEVESFLEKEFLLSHRRVRIITGKGSGALQKAVRTYLLDSHCQFETAKFNEGGEGALVVQV